MKDIRTNVYVVKVTPLWETNPNTQFILDPYVATSYYTSYLTQIDKFVMNEFKPSLKKCKDEKIDANLRIKKLSNVFLNV
jgi:hypothetical protein